MVRRVPPLNGDLPACASRFNETAQRAGDPCARFEKKLRCGCPSQAPRRSCAKGLPVKTQFELETRQLTKNQKSGALPRSVLDRVKKMPALASREPTL